MVNGKKLVCVKRADGTISRTQIWNHLWQQIGIWAAILVPLLPELRVTLSEWFAAYPWAVPLIIVGIKAVDQYYRATTTQGLK